MNRARASVSVSILVAAAVVGACGNSTPTPPPQLTPQATTPVASLVPEASATPTLAPTATPTASPSATPEPSPTVAPTGSTAQGGSVCSGTPKTKDFFTAAGKYLQFDVYCAVLPADYWAQQAQYERTNNGWLETYYENARGFQLVLVEGYGCPPGAPCLSTFESMISKFLTFSGRIWLGDQVADLYVMAGGPGQWSVYYAISHPRYGLYYIFAGMGMSQNRFETFSKALVKVPKS